MDPKTPVLKPTTEHLPGDLNELLFSDSELSGPDDDEDSEDIMTALQEDSDDREGRQ